MKTREELKHLMCSIRPMADAIAAIELSKMFLEHTKLKVGDEIECYFSYYHGNSKTSYHTGGVHTGVIKSYPNGVIYIESLLPLTIAKQRSNNKVGRGRQDWYEYEKQHIKVELKNY